MVKIGKALRSEIEKVALSGPLLARYAKARATQSSMLDTAANVLRGWDDVMLKSTTGKQHKMLSINKAVAASEKAMNPKAIRAEAVEQGDLRRYNMEAIQELSKHPYIDESLQPIKKGIYKIE